MGGRSAHLTLRLDTSEPIELGDFVGAFTSLANEFERFLAEKSGAKAEARMFVREVRHGSVIADIIAEHGPYIVAIAGQAVTQAETAMVLEDFIRRWGGRLTALFTNKIQAGELENPADLKDFLKTVRSITADPAASHTLEAATFEDGRREVRAAFRFTAPEARTAEVNIEDRLRILADPATTPRYRVLMVFTRSDINNASLNKKSGERVVINEISDKPLALMYGSEVAEQRIKHEIREADDNVFKKGFVVDVLVRRHGGKDVAYSVIGLHSVIDID